MRLTPAPIPSAPEHRLHSQRGSLLVVALLFAAAISLALAGYLALARTTLKVAHRSYFVNDAANLAEAGLEEALYSFNLMATGTAKTDAWANWTFSGSDAMRTLAPFNRDQNAVAVVKVFVRGYDGTNPAPYAISQATITPFDGSRPIVKTLQISLAGGGHAVFGVAAINGLNLKGTTSANSFNSNPSNSPTGPWLAYSDSIANSNTAVTVLGGSIAIASGKIGGDLYLASGVAAPPASQVTGILATNFTLSFPLPVYPTAAGVSQSYNLGSSIPAILPAPGHQPASDGRYYYFVKNATISALQISAGRDVTIVGTGTNMTEGLSIQGTSSCYIYMDGTVTISKASGINNSSWAGALRIFTTTTGTCTMDNSSSIVACLYAPNATLSAKGGGSSGMLVGYFVARSIVTTGHMDFHFDEALHHYNEGTNPMSSSTTWKPRLWLDLQSAADRATVAGLTGNFMQ